MGKKLQPARKCAKKLSLQENCKNYNCKKICKKLSLQENANNYKCKKLVNINHKKRNRKICRKARVGNSLFCSSFFRSQKNEWFALKNSLISPYFYGFSPFYPLLSIFMPQGELLPSLFKKGDESDSLFEKSKSLFRSQKTSDSLKKPKSECPTLGRT